MKSKGVFLAAILTAVLSFSGNLWAYSGDGDGSTENPYQIANVADFQQLTIDDPNWNKSFILTADVNLAGVTLTPVGNSSTKFTGVFDGNGHTISNFTWNSASSNYVGLFGYVDDPNAKIKDLRLVDPNVKGHICVAALVGILRAGEVSGCGVEGGTVLGWSEVGGLVGYIMADIGNVCISNCYATSSISGDDDIGGLVGMNTGGGSIMNCYSGGSVTGTGHYIGGFVGENYGTILNCYATGPVGGVWRVGGLVGRNAYGGSISDSYATGTVAGDTITGGLVGETGWQGGNVSNCYSTGPVSGNGTIGGLAGSCGGTIENCYSTGSVTGGYHIGGFIGRAGGRISNCFASGFVSGSHDISGFAASTSGVVSVSFWDMESTGQSNGVDSGSSLGINGKTTTQMCSMSTFLGWGSESTVWTIDDTNNYPHLAWENSAGEPISQVLSDLLDGSGTEEDPYLIYTPNDLDLISLFLSEWDKHFKLMADIDLSGWSPTEPNLVGCFAGVFDGDGRTVTNFTFESSQGSCIGLFREVDDPNAKIKDLTLIDPNIHTGGTRAGAIVGVLREGEITGCGVDGGFISGLYDVGGLAGESYESIISYSYATGSVTATAFAGGLVGENNGGSLLNCYASCSVVSEVIQPFAALGGLVGASSGTISSCYANGPVTGIKDYMGGLVGICGTELTISNCYATGTVTSIANYVGGLVGYNYNSTISNCYATGSVSGNDYVGGFAGYNSGTISVSFWDTESSGATEGVGYGNDNGVYGLSTELMQMQIIYDIAGWDFVNENANGLNDFWTMNDGQGYPKLVWKLVNLVNWDGVNFKDYSFFADYWMQTDCSDESDCNGTDFDFSGNIDYKDLNILLNYWLE